MRLIGLAVILGLTLAPLAVKAQPRSGKVYRIAFLAPSGYASQMEALRGGLRDPGYVEGQNFVIEFR